MGSVHRGGENRTFRVNFSADGAARLRETVKEKLKEFMGDYTDDTLVEYVIVLLRNGRRKEEARNELDVFLGDDSDSFIAWLWDHLDSNLDLYIKPQEPDVSAVPRGEPPSQDVNIKPDLQSLNPESERGKAGLLSRSRRNREWKGFVGDGEPPPLRSSEIERIHEEAKPNRGSTHAKRSISPQHTSQKRSRHDERQQIKREVPSQVISAPRRLLQFAVRDAVATSRPSESAAESTLKRLRSVVSTSSEDAFDHPQKIRSVARGSNPMAAVIKAVAEAAQDVRKVKPSGNVFDRLSRATEGPELELVNCGEAAADDDEEYEDFSQIPEHSHSVQHPGCGYSEHYDGNMTMTASESRRKYDYITDDEGYDEPDVIGHANIPQTGLPSRSSHENLMTMGYTLAERVDDDTNFTRSKNLERHLGMANPSTKMVTVPANSRTWRPPIEEARKDVAKMDNQKPQLGSSDSAKKSDGQVIGKNQHIAVPNGNAQSAEDPPKEPQKAPPSSPGSYATIHSLEDADSRTVFVSNVHIAATKDSLSQHFNKLGEVLKVIINTDAATGQPVGSAIVEFSKKEAADNALSLDGSSFMSRVLKVVKRNTTVQKVAPAMTWPRLVRGSPFARFPRAAFARGIPGAFRARLPIRPGARSLQWKRDAQGTHVDGGGAVHATNIPPFPARRFTYVRTESKPGENGSST